MSIAAVSGAKGAKTFLSKKELEGFQADGYLIIKDFWPEDVLSEWERSIVRCFYLQGLKIDSIRQQYVSGNPLDYFSYDHLEKMLKLLEVEDKEAAYQVIPIVEASAGGKRIISHPKLLAVASDLLRCDPDLLTLWGPDPFINLPTSKRLLYHWHSETCYYPKRRNFLNVWFPTFVDKNESNGTMYFCRGSHKIEFRHFIEYQGYDKESHGKKNHFIQYEIPESELTEYEKVPVIATRRDLVVFHQAMVHTSSYNPSSKTSMATVLRVADYQRDLTLSGNVATVPFNVRSGNGDFGRPGLVPIEFSKNLNS